MKLLLLLWWKMIWTNKSNKMRHNCLMQVNNNQKKLNMLQLKPPKTKTIMNMCCLPNPIDSKKSNTKMWNLWLKKIPKDSNNLLKEIRITITKMLNSKKNQQFGSDLCSLVMTVLIILIWIVTISSKDKILAILKIMSIVLKEKKSIKKLFVLVSQMLISEFLHVIIQMI